MGSYTGKWWYDADKSPYTGCHSAGSASSVDLDHLTADTEYTFTAYDASGCNSADEIASETFTTLAILSVSNLDETSTSYVYIGDIAGAEDLRGISFTTGSSSNGYTVKSVTAKFDSKSGSPAAIRVEIYSQSGSNPGSSLVRLSGSNPDMAGN